ncbi:response regulator [Tsuneonella deserti]|uniref:Response regulator n=1 Tax=Tsuneonella deserti TaxID=2035528 RepID=A0ABQ1S3J5_9SPHN|nr:response regulator [Tsuneonella deserti]GGD92279.1 response regulator [Tsuneonella deserti]
MDLEGKTILVLEDEPIIAMALEDHLDIAGAIPVVAATLAQAHEALAEQPLDAAILDVNVHGEKSFPVAESLNSKGIPFVFASGYGDNLHEAAFAKVPTVTKPYNLEAIRQAFSRFSQG